jgi:hypothetical protein
MQEALRWAITWGVVGLVLGLVRFLGKTLPLAWLGPEAQNLSWSPFWIAALGAGAAAAGLGMGFLYACLWLWTDQVREAYDAPGLAGAVAPYAVCGGAAGLIAGLLVGGFTGALFFAVLGAGTAAALNWREIRQELERSRSRQRAKSQVGQRRSPSSR